MSTARWQQRWLPLVTFIGVFSGHALYLRHQFALPSDGWADVGVGQDAIFGFQSYIKAQDYYMGLSYAIGLAFAVWAFGKYIEVRRAEAVVGVAGSVTLVGVLMGAGCFLVGCCGSPMLGVYAALFGAKAFGVGKPIMAIITMLSVGLGYWCLSRRLSKVGCADAACKCHKP